MKEIQDILLAYQKWKAAGQALALATVIEVQQSSYRRPGARMLISEDGQWTGGISGGCLEGDTLKKAKLAIYTGQSAIITYDTRDGDPSQIGIGLGCNGLIRVLVTPLTGPSPSAMSTLIEASATRIPSLLITDLETGAVSHHFTSVYNGPYQQQAQAVLTSKKSLLATSPSGRAFVEYLPPAIHLYIFGSNYDVIHLAATTTSYLWCR